MVAKWWDFDCLCLLRWCCLFAPSLPPPPPFEQSNLLFRFTTKMVFERLKVSLKIRFRSLKIWKPNDDSYNKIEKSDSMRVGIRSRKARKLIEETLRVADSPKCTEAYSF
ncbi:unnamed protein product [Lactuca virosa]|uniref:Uncharacterized protein n=1 Tax=Lactuca virosa TaxID=75947 RepID=A0AAU9M2H0_9ASTR|nr:unnamed protein product [Lactuca virosa]